MNQTKSMNPIQTAVNFLVAIALAALAVGCASGNTLLDRENVAVAAGFKVITPKTPDQSARLRNLQPDKVSRIVVAGKTYYVLPDLQNNQAYVGGPKQFQVYQRDRRIQKQNSEHAATPSHIEVVEVTETGWTGWGGWDAVGGPDGMGAPGWY
jgi:hypothetical protein